MSSSSSSSRDGVRRGWRSLMTARARTVVRPAPRARPGRGGRLGGGVGRGRGRRLARRALMCVVVVVGLPRHGRHANRRMDG